MTRFGVDTRYLGGLLFFGGAFGGAAFGTRRAAVVLVVGNAEGNDLFASPDAAALAALVTQIAHASPRSMP